jgi:transcription antitermination factor NusG
VQAFLPGYLFAKIHPERIGDLLEIEGVDGVLRTDGSLKGGKVWLVPVEEVMDLFDRAQKAGAFDRAADFKEGDLVRILGVRFAGMIGEVKRARSKRIEIVINFIRMWVSADQIELLAA